MSQLIQRNKPFENRYIEIEITIMIITTNTFCFLVLLLLRPSQDLFKEQEMQFRAQLSISIVNSLLYSWDAFPGFSLYCVFASIGPKLKISSPYGVV